MNYANSDYGARLVDYSSEVLGCEAVNVLDQKVNTIWLSEEGLPQWLCLSLVNIHNVRNIVLRTVGWHCWHPYSTNPKVVILHVSADGSKFKQWDKFYATGPQKGSQLFCCAPISCALYPFLAFEITDVFGGNQTYMNRLCLYSEEISPSSIGSDTSQKSAEQISMISSQEQISIETNSVLQKLETALGFNDSSISDDEDRNHQDPEFLHQITLVSPTAIRFPTNTTIQPPEEDEFSDADSDSLPLTLTLSGERKEEKIGNNRIIGLHQSQQPQQLQQLPKSKSTEIFSTTSTHTNTRHEIPNRFEQTQADSSISPVILEERKNNLSQQQQHLVVTETKSSNNNETTELKLKEKFELFPSQVDLIESNPDHHDVSSLTNSQVKEKQQMNVSPLSRADSPSPSQTLRSQEVSNRISDLEGKMNSLLEAFQLLRTSEVRKEELTLPSEPMETRKGQSLEETNQFPSQGSVHSPPVNHSITRPHDNENKKKKRLVKQEQFQQEEQNEDEMRRDDRYDDENSTADTLSVTSNLSKLANKTENNKPEPISLPHHRHHSSLNEEEELNNSKESIVSNRSSTTLEALQMMKNLESLIKTIIPPTQRPRTHVNDDEQHRSHQQQDSKKNKIISSDISPSSALPSLPSRSRSPSRSHSYAHSRYDTTLDQHTEPIDPQPSRASPLQSCFHRSHSPQKGPGGGFRKEKFQLPLPSSSMSSSTSTGCSCAYSSFPSRVNPSSLLDHPTPLLPPNLNLPVPTSHRPPSPSSHSHSPSPSRDRHSHRHNHRHYHSHQVSNEEMNFTAQRELDDPQREDIADIVEKLHQKILERTLKEAELALIRKTKKNFQSTEPRDPSRKKEVITSSRFGKKL